MSRSTTVVGLALIAIAALAAFAFATITTDFMGSDFTVYRAGGQAMLEGESATGMLYKVGMDNFGGWALPFTYPPFAALVFIPFAVIDFNLGLVLINLAGFGMGIERWMMWLLQHDDIRDLQIVPRLNGLTLMP